MHALIVVGHPNAGSLTHAIANEIGNGIADSGSENSFELADLFAQGFDPRFSQDDIDAFEMKAPFPDDVLAEQKRIEAADTLVLVFPIYWWSMPAIMKGWIDRVFSNGWAYKDIDGEKVIKKLNHLKVHLVAIGGAGIGTFARHGYFGAMKLQIHQGIFDYCGVEVATSELLLLADGNDPEEHVKKAREIGAAIPAKTTKRELDMVG
ncbi:NAD(P)H-dependent oxidoreductase [Thalassospira sp. ER-Se-21-Dark]|uniref:NAD(P)H-dependent oxidoreductase n=1 Tax=Thalassospira sp. ER-Se-21-Dark TaxID=2585190 RepID=UPI001B30145D|nr:NAD(P)H-dependent oxidoreductase [Thalassospira sp. ER-Se-21-Dark]MBP3125983.1 NAD(P)H-dependent oxidoreductase [Thalassospira sp. ER-Se-21-Dark]